MDYFLLTEAGQAVLVFYKCLPATKPNKIKIPCSKLLNEVKEISHYEESKRRRLLY